MSGNGGVDYLYEPKGAELHWDGLKPNMPAPQQASFSGSSNPFTRPGLGRTSQSQAGRPAPEPPEPHKMSPDELLRYAKAMLEHQETSNNAALAAGPAVQRIADGTRANGYNTELTDGAEKAYQDYAKRQFPNGMEDDYDLRGAFAHGTSRDGNLHYPDTYKKPNHPTFSDESMYAPMDPEAAGHWAGDRYIPADTLKGDSIHGPSKWDSEPYRPGKASEPDEDEEDIEEDA